MERIIKVTAPDSECRCGVCGVFTGIKEIRLGSKAGGVESCVVYRLCDKCREALKKVL